MNNLKLIIAYAFYVLLIISCKNQNENYLDEYNIVWNSQSKNSAESMSVGGHSIGCNVWVENGDVLFYAQRSGSFTENNEYHKLGRFRLKLTPNPFTNSDKFKQELKLHEGYVEITGQVGENEVKVDLWIEAQRPVIHIDIESNVELNSEVLYENWRTETSHLNTEINYGPAFGCFSWICYPDSIFRYKDFTDFENNGVLFYHRNRDDKLLIDYIIKQQGLENVEEKIVDTQKGRTFGGFVKGNGFKPAGKKSGKYFETEHTAWSLKSEQAKKKHSVKIYTNVGQYDCIQGWNTDLKNLVDEDVSDKVAKQNTLDWWANFWNKSRIKINSGNKEKDKVAWELARNYQIFRYQLGCNFYGEYPTKFNGGNFTFDPNLVFEKGNPNKNTFTPCGTPDWRAWGGGSFTAQNQRLLYWPMLKTGDFDGMLTQFDFYKKALPSAIARVEKYWNHKGACFTEQIENFGLPIAAGWGWSEPNAKRRQRTKETLHGTMVNPAIQYHYESQLEFSFMILEYFRYTGSDISDYMDFIKNSIVFFDEHYQMRSRELTGKPLDENGKLVITPSTACESYKGAVNPVDACAGLIACTNSLLALPDQYITESEKEYFKKLLHRIPDLSFNNIDGDKIIKPAHSWTHYRNNETPQFYPLFPFNLFELATDSTEIDVFKNTWKHGKFNKEIIWSWRQDGIFYARMGMTEKAKWYNTEKLKSSDQRFPTFWGPGFDWVPDHNWGGAGMIGLQEMLMQTNGENILLFPAWPLDWDVDFKLHAPQNTIVEGELKDGKLKSLNVQPESRKKDIIIIAKSIH